MHVFAIPEFMNEPLQFDGWIRVFTNLLDVNDPNDIIIEISSNDHPEVIEWCSQMFEHNDAAYSEFWDEYFFKNEQDFIAFKLRWM
jgi:hypothetical protein